MEKVHTYDADASEKYVCPNIYIYKQGLRGSLPWWSEDSCRTDHVCEFVNRFPADRRKVEVSFFSVVFETASAAAKAVTAVLNSGTSCVFRGAQNLITTVLLLWQNLGPLIGPLIFVWKN